MARSDDFFIGLNARLPRKREIAQAVIRHHDGRVLMVQQTYKDTLELPGGVVDPGESPRAAAAREVREELGVDLPPVGLLAVDWLPPWYVWDDATLYLFDFGRHGDDLQTRLRLQATEITGAMWCDRATVAERASRSAAPALALLWDHDGPTLYLEDGREPRPVS